MAMAEDQDGVVARAQLFSLGLSRGKVDRLVAKGWLIPLHYGVYAVGHRPRTTRGWYTAALLAGGVEAALGHWCAGAMHEMCRARGRIHLVVARHHTGIAGVVSHRPRVLLPGDVVEVDGLPCTSPGKTVLDVAQSASSRALERMIDQAEVMRLHLPLDELRARSHCRPGGTKLRRVIDWHVAGSTITESEAEEAFWAIVRDLPIPRPRLQARFGRERPDFVWDERRVVVEIDGRSTHDTTAQFELDRIKDAERIVAGWRPLRFTRRRVVHRPHEVARVLLATVGGQRVA